MNDAVYGIRSAQYGKLEKAKKEVEKKEVINE